MDFPHRTRFDSNCIGIGTARENERYILSFLPQTRGLKWYQDEIRGIWLDQPDGLRCEGYWRKRYFEGWKETIGRRPTWLGVLSFAHVEIGHRSKETRYFSHYVPLGDGRILFKVVLSGVWGAMCRERHCGLFWYGCIVEFRDRIRTLGGEFEVSISDYSRRQNKELISPKYTDYATYE